MTRPSEFDRDTHLGEIWKVRLRWFIHYGRFGMDVAHGILLVVFGVLAGGIAGGLAAGRWGNSAFWAGMVAGAVAGGAVGIAGARKVFFRRPEVRVPDPFTQPVADAPHWPGVEERFEKTRARLRALGTLMAALLVAITYLRMADDFGWPVPAAPSKENLLWALAGLAAALLALVAAIARCPKCRGVLWNALDLRRCPRCGVALRD